MIPKPYHVGNIRHKITLPVFMRCLIDSRFTGMRSTSAHSCDSRHGITISPLTLTSFLRRSDIPLDKISGCSYAFAVETDRGTRAIPIGATGISRHGHVPTTEMEQPKRMHTA
jgi:hypothetical protein